MSGDGKAIPLFEVNIAEPESLSVGQLNQIVRELREQRYQLNVLLSEAREELALLKEKKTK